MESTIEKLDDYIYLKLSGEGNFDDLKHALQETYNECEKCDFSKVLLDFLDIEDVDYEKISSNKRIVFAAVLMEIFHRRPKIKVASLAKSEFYDGTVKEFVDKNKFNFDVFFTRDEALQWLGVSQDDKTTNVPPLL